MTISQCFSALMRPGMRLMRRMRLPMKMGLLGAMMVPPMVFLLANSILDAQTTVSTAKAEQEGALLTRELTELMVLTQTLRTQHTFVDAGGVQLSTARDQTRVQLRQAADRTAQHVTRLQYFDAADLWTKIAPRIQAAAEGRVDPGVAGASATFDATVSELTRAIELVAERSLLLFDPDAAPYFLMSLGSNSVPKWMESIGRLQSVGVDVFTRDEPSGDRVRVMRSLADAAAQAQVEVQNALQALTRSGVASLDRFKTARDVAGRFTLSARRAFEEARGGEPMAYLLSGREAAQAIALLDEQVWEEFDDHMQRRIEHRLWRLAAECGAALIGVLGVGYLALCFYWSFTGSLGAVHLGVRAVAQGDLSTQVRVEGNDELADVGHELESMSARLSSLVGEIRNSAVRVDEAGAAVAEDGLALSRRTEEQAVSLRQTVSTVQQLSAAVGTNAEAAAALQTLTDDLRNNAGEGNEAMANTVAAMGSLERSVDRVAEINAVIDDIAFQTNLLALNASVEAARAGEAGKGFSVVAGEIRQLANRCTEAASEVQELIETTSAQAHASVACIQEANGRLTSIVAGVDEVSQRLNVIASSSADQSRALQEVTSSVGSLDDITQQNATMVGKSTAASRALADQASALRSSVASIQLRRGSADEARALVERAVGHITQVGWSRACDSFNSGTGDWVDRNMHLFAMTLDGSILVHSDQPTQVGRSLYDLAHLPAPLADAFLKAAREAMACGGGWIEYRWTEPGCAEATDQSAYLHAVDEGTFLGCSVLRESFARVGQENAKSGVGAYTPFASGMTEQPTLA